MINLALLHFAAVASPGPDNLLVLNYSDGSLKKAFALSLGICLGILIESVLVVFGLGTSVLSSPKVLLSVQIAGSIYLIYLGTQCWRASLKEPATRIFNQKDQESVLKLFSKGFLTFATNPKAFIYFMAVLPQFLGTDTENTMRIMMVVIIVCVSFFWFFSLSLLMGISKKIKKFQSSKLFLRITGTLFISFAVHMLTG